jgi:eukaryotic-like serine/threonine-protein kinase
VLAAGRPKGQQGGLGKDATLRNAIDAAEPEITRTFQDQPLVEASIRHTLGLSYWALTEYGLAIKQYERALLLRKAALGADHPATLKTTNNLAHALAESGKLDQALPLFEDTLSRQRARLGSDHADTLITLNNLAVAYFDIGKRDQALALQEETLALKKAKLGPDDPSTLTSMNNLAQAYRQVGKLDQAITLLKETLQRLEAKNGPDHPHTLACLGNLATAYSDSAKWDDALRLQEDGLRRSQAALGLEHSATLVSMANLAITYRRAGKVERALPLLEQAVKLMTAKDGRDHPNTVATMNALALAFLDAGKPDQALPLFEEALKLRTAKLGADHPETLTTMSNLGHTLRVAGKLDLALPLLLEAATGMEKRRFQSTMSSRMVTNLIGCQETLKQFDQAEIWRRKWLERVKIQGGTDSLPYSSELAGLGWNLLNQRKWTDAEALLRESLAIRSKKESDAWTTFDTQSMLGASLTGQQKFAAAERPLLDGYAGLEKRQANIPSADKARLTDALERLVQLYDAWGKPEKAAEWRAKQK